MTRKTNPSLRPGVRYERPDASVFSFRAEGLLCVSADINIISVNDLSSFGFDE